MCDDDQMEMKMCPRQSCKYLWYVGGTPQICFVHLLGSATLSLHENLQ